MILYNLQSRQTKKLNCTQPQISDNTIENNDQLVTHCDSSNEEMHAEYEDVRSIQKHAPDFGPAEFLVLRISAPVLSQHLNIDGFLVPSQPPKLRRLAWEQEKAQYSA